MAKKLNRKKKVMVWLGVLWGTFAISLVLFAFSGGPPPGTTGGFGEGDCTRCHVGTVNSGPGGVTITLPEFYTSADTFPIRVTVSDPDQRRWGFEISARIQSGSQAGQQAGVLIHGDDGFSQLLGSSQWHTVHRPHRARHSIRHNCRKRELRLAVASSGRFRRPCNLPRRRECRQRRLFPYGRPHLYHLGDAAPRARDGTLQFCITSPTLRWEEAGKPRLLMSTISPKR